MTSKTDLANMALVNIGSTNLIASLTEKSTEARVCNLFMENILKEVQREIEPQTSKVIKALSLIEEQPSEKYQYIYKYPKECIKFIRIESGMINESSDSKIPFEKTEKDGVTVIKCNEAQASAEYIYHNDDLTKWNSDLITAASFLLSFRIAPGLDRGQRRNDMYTIYGDFKENTIKNDRNENVKPKNNDSEFIRVRQ